MFEYTFKTEPYAHQLSALTAGLHQEYFGYLMDMGTGKTKVTIDNFSHLFQIQKITGFLLVAPAGVYRNWVKEIEVHAPIDTNVVVWNNSNSKANLKAREAVCIAGDTCQVLLMNVEAFSAQSGRGFALAQKFLTNHTAFMAVDESTTIKTPSAKRSKNVVTLGGLATYRRILTGSPVTNSPLDLFMQSAFLSSHALGIPNYYAYRTRYAKMITQNFGGKSFKQVVGYQRLDELQNKLRSYSYRVTKEECLDLPEKIFQTREVELTKEQLAAYKSMRDIALVKFGDELVSASIALTQMLRLHQIICGSTQLDDGTTISIPNNRVTALLDVISETSGKCLIWAQYRENLSTIADAIRKEYGAGSLVTYHGETTSEERTEAIEKFQDPSSDVRFFLGNAQTGGYGITLTQATTVVYYSNSFSLEHRLQSEDRAHRIGQHHPVNYVDLVARGTVDERIIIALRDKISLASQVTGDTIKAWIGD